VKAEDIIKLIKASQAEEENFTDADSGRSTKEVFDLLIVRMKRLLNGESLADILAEIKKS
jgi:hypothetical protein